MLEQNTPNYISTRIAPQVGSSEFVAKRQKIVIGVTGHRNIDRQDRKLKALIRKECRALARAHADKSFVILSGLAEGADRMVARIVMKELDAKLIAVLAVPRESFVTDFETAASRREFTTLLNRADHIITAPLLSKQAWKTYSPARDRQYAWEGAFLVLQSNVLMAVWDGAASRGHGGTGDVVRWFRRRKVPKTYLDGSASLARAANLPVRQVPRKTRTLLHFHPARHVVYQHDF